MNIVRFLLIVAAAVFTPGCAIDQDASDQERLREIFAVPPEAQIIEYRGFPARSGFGQREGLRLSARYRLSAPVFSAWLASARNAGWRELPFPQSIRSRFRIRFDEAPLDTAHGLYLCRTAGNEILNTAETRPCEKAEAMNDVRLGVFDQSTGVLSVLVAAGY
jgi:hypothetical protein